MQVTILGEKMRVEVLLLCLVVGGIIACVTVCSCARGAKEGMSLLGAPLNYSMDHGIGGSVASWEAKGADAVGRGYNSWFQHLAANKGGSVPPSQLFMFGDNEMRPECCPSTYSGSTGCVCVSEDQMKYLNERGGNRTFATEY